MTNSINRKEDYKNLCKMFLACTHADDAHRLSSYVFGVEHMRHIQGDFQRKTESVNSNIFHEEPFEIIIKPRVRTYRERLNRYAIKDKSKEKQELLDRILEERKEQEKLINKYINDGQINFENLGYISQYVRITLLRWLSDAMISDNFVSKNENGKIINVINPKEKRKCTINCEDGDFVMPAFILAVE
jgi:uncharacterized protein (TIGR02677 family)